MSFLPLDILESGAALLGTPLSREQLAKLEVFAELLVDANRTVNLTRIVDPRDIVTNHYLDSLACLRARDVKTQADCVDVGTGGGFPGIPVAIARPDIRVTLMDSSRKKLEFAAGAVEKLGLDNVETLHIRAEDAGRTPGLRERWDAAWTRALAPMKALVELCIPLVRVNGFVVAQKSRTAGVEIDDAKALTGRLGGVLSSVKTVSIPHSDLVRLLVVIDKARPTPADMPRPYSRIVGGLRGSSRLSRD